MKAECTCDPFVFGPALAIERSPLRVCLILKFSSEREKKKAVLSLRLGVRSKVYNRLTIKSLPIY